MKTAYQRDLEDPEYRLLSIWRNKKGYKIAIFEKPNPGFSGGGPERIKSLVTYHKEDFIWFYDTGWGDDGSNIEEYLHMFGVHMKRIKNKQARRQFIRMIRNFPLHPGTVYGDFLDDRFNVDWGKIEKYYEDFKQNKL